jgi:hypothetical protein
VGRRVGAWTLAAVVTVALVVGGVLVAGGGRDRSPAVLPALDLGATGTAAGDAATAAEPAPARAGAEPAAPAGPAETPRIWPQVTYRLTGPLPTLPERAQAWKVGDDSDAGRVAALAAALGLRGRQTQDASGWTVTGARHHLTVNRLAGMPWTYTSSLVGACLTRAEPGTDRGVAIPCLDPDRPVSNQPSAPPAPGGGSAGSVGSAPGGAAGSGGGSSPGAVGTGRPVPPVPPVTVKPVLPVRPVRPADLPSRAQAERIARDLAANAGLDLAGAEVTVADAYAARLVTIAPAVGGMPTTGFAWTVGVGAKGRIEHASGFLATPEPAGTYPLIGVQEGFERLKKTPPFGPIFRADAPAIEPAPCPPGGKLPCATKPLATRNATVTGVRLGLQLFPAVAKSGRPADLGYLLPAYLFEVEGGWSDVRPILAVQDRYLTRP